MTHFTQILLQLKDKNITFSDKVDEVILKDGHKSLMFYAKLSYIPKSCPCCHTSNHSGTIVKNGTRSSRISLVPISGLNAYLKLSKQRFYCCNCHTSFTAQSPIVKKHAFISNRLKHWVIHQLNNTLSTKTIAQYANMSVFSVRRIVKEAAKSLSPNVMSQLPENLSFDEFKGVSSTDKKMNFIYCDAVTHRLIDVIDDRKYRALSQHFERYSLKERQQVKTVTIDMSFPYISFIKSYFPNASIHIDKFHLVQALNRELNRYRIQVMNRFRSSDRALYNKFKRYWKLILANPDNLNDNKLTNMPLFKTLTNTTYIVDYLLSQDSVLKNSYELVHELLEAIRCNDKASFHSILHHAKHLSIASGLRRQIRTFNKLLPYIDNTFNKPHLSNGPIEGLNNKIKVLKRNAFGYRSFSYFRARILLMSKLYSSKEKEIMQITA